MTYDEAIDYLYEIPRFSKKTSMENSRNILAALGHPEQGMKYIHVAGTNGKGSVCAYVTRILLANHKRTGTFTSPHLVRNNERFQIDGVEVDDETFMWSFYQVYELCRDESKGLLHPSYFEFLFLMGLLIFQKKQVEYAVLEVGLGGRLDATNVIEKPLVSIITSISLDHTEILGDTIEQIAGEKAGIIKPGVPVIYDASDERAAGVISQVAGEKKAPAIPLKTEDVKVISTGKAGIDFCLTCGRWAGQKVSLPFVARYQAMNAGLALTAAEKVLPELTGVIDALKTTVWPGRMEPVLPGVYLDGAHNADGIRAFLDTVNEIPCKGKKYLMFSAVMEKDYESMIASICSQADFEAVVLTEIDSYRALSAKVLEDVFMRNTDRSVYRMENLNNAIDCALGLKKAEDALFIAGSLYLIGEVKEILSHRQ